MFVRDLQGLTGCFYALLRAPDVGYLSVRKLPSGLSSRVERLCSKGSVLTRLIVLIRVEAYVDHENLQAKQAQARPADVNEMTFII